MDFLVPYGVIANKLTIYRMLFNTYIPTNQTIILSLIASAPLMIYCF